MKRASQQQLRQRAFKKQRIAATGPYMSMPRYIKPTQRRRPLPPGALPEKKFFDTTLSFNVDSTMEVPATGQLVLIPQGDTSTTRDGRQCTIESIQIRASCIFVPGAAANAATLMHLFLILDRQANGAAAAVTDVFTSANSSLALLNLDNDDRFVIVKKWVKTFNSQAGATTAYNNQQDYIEWFKKVDIPLTFSSTAGAITELRTNNLFLVAGAQNSDDLIQVGGICRVRFRG